MKVKVPLLLLLVLAAVGYAFATENGRAQRDMILVRLRRKDADDSSSLEYCADVPAEGADA